MRARPSIPERRAQAVAATIRARDRSAKAIETLAREGTPPAARTAVTEAHADLEALVSELLGDRRAA